MWRLLIISSLVVSACATAKSQKTKGNQPVREFKEDLSTYKPLYNNPVATTTKTDAPIQQAVPKNHINDFLREKLDSLYVYNIGICCTEGYRILIYSGSSSEEARNLRNAVYNVLPLEKSYTEWRSPSFKVKVGDFVDKLEAYYAYAKLIKTFPNAIVVPDKVNIVRENK